MTLPKNRPEAKARGEKFFLNNTPCKRGHVVKKYVSDGSCTQCSIDRAKARYKVKKEEVLAQHKARYKADPEKVKARVNKRRVDHPDKVRAEKRVEYRRNKARYIARAANWAKDNPEKAKACQKAWAVRNPDRVYQCVVRRRMRIAKRTPVWLTKDDRRFIRGLYAEARAIGEDTGVKRQVDHIVPLYGRKVSGLHVPSNLQILTSLENRSKGNKF